MSARSPEVYRPLHPALERQRSGRSLAGASLSDQQRLALLLQGGGLLSHLEYSGWTLDGGWRGAVVDGEGLLRGVSCRRGRGPEAPQRLLLDLARRLFGGRLPVDGRGQARRSARALGDRWRQGLLRIGPDRAVRQVLESAPFLWRRRFAAPRATLAAEHVGGDQVGLWVAGPPWFRRPIMAGARDLDQLQRRLAGPESRRYWGGAARASGLELARRGRWRAALAAWAERPPRRPQERLMAVRACLELGRPERGLRLLRGLEGSEAKVMRLRCHCGLGRIGAARYALDELRRASLSREQTVEVAECAVRLYANAGDPAGCERWLRRARAAAERPLEARLLAAAAAWDRGDRPRLDENLERARPALDEVELGWRWRHLEALAALDQGNGRRVVARLGSVLRRHRRRLSPTQAAELWNDLALGRALEDDLPGAERALHHAATLLEESEGPRLETLGLVNLAEIRLRRGRFEGVREALRRSLRENRRAGNWRGWAYDSELWARYLLARGRVEEALSSARRALRELAARRIDPREGELRAVAARALGWLGRSREARRELERGGGDALQLFDLEERPALLAHAGEREAAVAAIDRQPLAALWRALLEGFPVAEQRWRAVAALEPYRAARWVLDVELLRPGWAPRRLVQAAVRAFEAAGCGALAERLTELEAPVWHALAAYCDETRGDAAALARLFAAAGHPEARLVWRRRGDERVILAGDGGGARLEAVLAGGRLRLSVSRADTRARALLALARRDLDGALGAPPASVESGIVGRSPALTRELGRLDRLASSDLAVLIRGETGTGKELAARRVHAGSARSGRCFLALNCAALSESLLLSELFGHARGAFTGADRDRAGIFEEGAGGTVFLDEIGDLPLEAQGALLRVLQEGEVRRLGETRARRVDVRVVAATHRDLAARVRRGEFREDLLYRLKVAVVELPPLRERGEDVLLLAEHFLAAIAGDAAPRLAARTRAALAAYAWPGNVRELKNRIEVAVALARGGVIEPRDVDLGEPRDDGGGDYHRAIQEVRERLVRGALRATDGNQAAAARRLGITRQALSYLVRKLDIDAGAER